MNGTQSQASFVARMARDEDMRAALDSIPEELFARVDNVHVMVGRLHEIGHYFGMDEERLRELG